MGGIRVKDPHTGDYAQFLGSVNGLGSQADGVYSARANFNLVKPWTNMFGKPINLQRAIAAASFEHMNAVTDPNGNVVTEESTTITDVLIGGTLSVCGQPFDFHLGWGEDPTLATASIWGKRNFLSLSCALELQGVNASGQLHPELRFWDHDRR